MKRILFSFLALATLTACHQPAEPEAIRALDSICSTLFSSDEPGAAVLVMKGDSVLFDKGYGLADLGTQAPIDGNTFFNIASVSKQFTAVAILQLAEERLLSLNDAVAQYFSFPYAFWKEVRIKHLLSHCSGVPDLRGDMPLEAKRYATDSTALSYLPKVNELHFLPGSCYEYMNPTYVLLGALVEQRSEQPFSTYMQEHIFAPAGMHAFYFADSIPALGTSAECPFPLAHAYDYDTPHKWYEYDYGEETFFATRPDGGIYTSTHEFVKWEQALRNHKVLTEESLLEAWSPQIRVTGSEWSDYQNRPNTWYGLGWFIEPPTDSTKTVIYHTGDNGGFQILAARYPEDNALVLVFSNRSDWDRYALMQQIEHLFDF